MSPLGSEDVDARAKAQVGRTLRDKYHLDRLLGCGGMAAVYEATHRNGHRVAIKMLYPELGLDVEVLRRFVREGYAANRVNHPGAVRVLDDDRSEDGTAFLVMELLEGKTVDSIQTTEGVLEAWRVLPWMDQLLDVLAAAHAEGIIHRDVKPDNLFLTVDGRIKVLDFGIARVRDGSNMTATRTGTPFGTPPFMSPEQALSRSREIDARCDVFSTGATMFLLLSGRYVHQAETASEMLVRAATERAPPLSSIAPDVPAPIAAVVDRALAFAKTDRWPDARAMQAALRDAHARAFGRPMPALPPVPPGWTRAASSGSSDRALPRLHDGVSDTGPTVPREAPPKAPVELDATRLAPLQPPRPEIAATAPPTTSSPKSTPSRRARRVLALASLLAIVAAGAATWALRMRPAAPAIAASPQPSSTEPSSPPPSPPPSVTGTAAESAPPAASRPSEPAALAPASAAQSASAPLRSSSPGAPAHAAGHPRPPRPKPTASAEQDPDKIMGYQ